MRMLLLGALVLSFVGVGAARPRAEVAPGGASPARPVRLTPASGVGAQADVEAALGKPLEEGSGAWDVRAGKPRRKAQLRTCHDYLKVAADGVETETPVDQRPFNNAAAHCEALALLRGARPSGRSFLEGFKLDANAPRALPADFYLDVSPEDTRRVRKAASQGLAWKAFDPKVRCKINKRGALDCRGDGYDSALTEYARGDFDHDGIEDILIRRTASPARGSMVEHAVFLLTRASESTPLKVVKVWRQAY